MKQIRTLPTGIQSFEVLRTQGYLYVDKTAMIHRLALNFQRKSGTSVVLGMENNKLNIPHH